MLLHTVVVTVFLLLVLALLPLENDTHRLEGLPSI